MSEPFYYYFIIFFLSRNGSTDLPEAQNVENGEMVEDFKEDVNG